MAINDVAEFLLAAVPDCVNILGPPSTEIVFRRYCHVQ
jgi:hypothetical protein